MQWGPIHSGWVAARCPIEVDARTHTADKQGEDLQQRHHCRADTPALLPPCLFSSLVFPLSSSSLHCSSSSLHCQITPILSNTILLTPCLTPPPKHPSGTFAPTSTDSDTEQQQQEAPKLQTVMLDVGGMMCGGCSAAVKNILLQQPGVQGAAVNLITHAAAVTVK